MNKPFYSAGFALVRVTITLCAVIAAVFAGGYLWQYYMLSPWTRDGRIRAEVVGIAPDISGRVVELLVTDNQFVHKGDKLFVVDPDTYRLALAQAEATVENQHQNWLLKQADADRRHKLLGKSVVSTEEWQDAEFTAAAAKAAYLQAVASRDLAQLNMTRTIIRSPVNGYITNLHLRLGDYALTGQTQLSIVDSDSFWVAGYFEETKLPHIHENDPVSIKLMGVTPPLAGHVENISRGIADANSGAAAQGLANVDPVFTWVRLAQRIPVRIHIDRVPKNVLIASGLTCTLTVGKREEPIARPGVAGR
jgi:multidrug resistance efflux pump